jgi:hypothetical protein
MPTEEMTQAFYVMLPNHTLRALRDAFMCDVIYDDANVAFCRGRVAIIERILLRRQSEGVRMDEEPAC